MPDVRKTLPTSQNPLHAEFVYFKTTFNLRFGDNVILMLVHFKNMLNFFVVIIPNPTFHTDS